MASELHVDSIKHSGGTSSMTITSSGVMSAKTAIMQVEAEDIDQTVGASNTKVEWERVIIDTLNGWSTSNHRYTPTIAGYYLVGGCLRLRMDTINSFFNIQIKKNGSDAAINVIESQHQMTSDTINHGVYPCSTGFIEMNGSSDYIEMWVQGDESMTAHDSTTQKSHFFAQLVHAT